MAKRKHRKASEVEEITIVPLSYHKLGCEDPDCPCDDGYWHCSRCDVAVGVSGHDCPEATVVSRPIGPIGE